MSFFEKVTELNKLREKVDRYERFLRALADKQMVEGKWCNELLVMDVVEWASETAAALLDGQAAECPLCSTPLHDGACVGVGDEEGDDAENDDEESDWSEMQCRVCGCTDLDCRGCIERTGKACHWVEANLCSACAPGAEGDEDGHEEEMPACAACGDRRGQCSHSS